ncbi:MAG: hypothetical protein P8Y63_00550 [Deltaproteobacteria bacterium]|jgi:rubrerythrin
MRHDDLKDMIEILSLAAARQEAEEHFFRRSADASTSKVAKALFTEIADDLLAYRGKLEKRKQRMLDALADLELERRGASR